jgi:hypothetical protein
LIIYFILAELKMDEDQDIPMEQRWPLCVVPFFLIETCQNCEQHQWNTHHRSEKYKENARMLKEKIEEAIPMFDPL